MKPSSRHWLMLALLLLAWITLMGLRSRWIETSLGAYLDCRGCFTVATLSADAVLLAGFAGLLLIAGFMPRGWLQWPWRLAAWLLVVVYVADFLILKTFSVRLLLARVGDFGGEGLIVWQQLQGAVGGLLPALGLLLLLALLGYLIFRVVLNPAPVRLALLLCMVAATALAVIPDQPQYVNNFIYRNVIDVNVSGREAERYSAEYAAAARTRHQAQPRHCIAGPARRDNVVVLIIESWSLYQSRRLSGIRDWTPRLDALAARYRYYDNFFASGFTTNEGLAGLLSGAPLVAPFSKRLRAGDFGDEWGVEATLPRVFASAGYHTAFLTTGPLHFTRKDEWLEDIGFDYMEGHRHPFYADWPRPVFHAAPDEALYRRALEWQQAQQPSEDPYLLVLETVSTHPPYEDPVSGGQSLERTFRYADAQAGWYVDQLQARGFFDNGTLLIVSDHRTMNPLLPEEQANLGLAAVSKIPLIWIDSNTGGDVAPGVEDAVLQQSDLVPSMAQFLQPEACFGLMQSSLLTPDALPPKCALHARGSDHGLIDVICAGGEGQVAMAGDDTRFMWQQGLDRQTQQRILDYIAVTRLDGLARQQRRQPATSGE